MRILLPLYLLRWARYGPKHDFDGFWVPKKWVPTSISAPPRNLRNGPAIVRYSRERALFNAPNLTPLSFKMGEIWPKTPILADFDPIFDFDPDLKISFFAQKTMLTASKWPNNAFFWFRGPIYTPGWDIGWFGPPEPTFLAISKSQKSVQNTKMPISRRRI